MIEANAPRYVLKTLEPLKVNPILLPYISVSLNLLKIDVVSGWFLCLFFFDGINLVLFFER
jgi:hypothetical protein